MLSIAHLIADKYKARVVVRDFHKGVSSVVNALFSFDQRRVFLLGSNLKPGEPGWLPTLSDLYAGRLRLENFVSLCYLTRFKDIFLIPFKHPEKKVDIKIDWKTVRAKDLELIDRIKERIKPTIILDDLPGLLSLDKDFRIEYVHVPSIATSDFTLACFDGLHKSRSVEVAIEECLNAISLGYAEQIGKVTEPLGWVYLKFRPKVESDRSWLDRAKRRLLHFKLQAVVPYSKLAEVTMSAGEIPTEVGEDDPELASTYDSLARGILREVPGWKFR